MKLTMRNYGLVLPKNYVSIEKDEMEYIDGGLYISYNDIYKMVDMLGFSLKSRVISIGGLAVALTPIIPIATVWINAIPLIGQAIFCMIIGYAAAFAVNCAIAYFSHKGVSVEATWFGPQMKVC